MLKVTVEVWPGGSKEQRYTIGTAYICNDGTGHDRVGNYEATITGCPSEDGRQSTDTVYVQDFDRTQGAWELLTEILEERKLWQSSL